VDGIVTDTKALAQTLEGLSDKDVGLRLSEFPEHVRSLIFPYRKQGGDLLSGRTRQALFRSIRPTGNELDGYVPSYAMARVTDEAA
jgi:RNA ligase